VKIQEELRSDSVCSINSCQLLRLNKRICQEKMREVCKGSYSAFKIDTVKHHCLSNFWLP
jgi:hypothetical protein